MGSRSTLRLIGKARKEQTECHVPGRRFRPGKGLSVRGRFDGKDAVRRAQDKHSKRVAVLGEGVVQGERRGRGRRNGRGIVPSFLMKVDWAEGQPSPLEDAHSTWSGAIGSAPPGCSCLHLLRLFIAPFPILFPQILAQARLPFSPNKSQQHLCHQKILFWPKTAPQMLISARRCTSELRQRRCVRPLVLD